MTAEQEHDWIDFQENVWLDAFNRATLKAGGVMHGRADVWDSRGVSPYLELELSLSHIQPRDPPLAVVKRFEDFARHFRAEVLAAMTQGKFDFKPVGTAERLAQLNRVNGRTE